MPDQPSGENEREAEEDDSEKNRLTEETTRVQGTTPIIKLQKGNQQWNDGPEDFDQGKSCLLLSEKPDNRNVEGNASQNTKRVWGQDDDLSETTWWTWQRQEQTPG